MKPVFQLRQLILSALPLWLVVWFFGVVTLISMLGLLLVAGWFVTMAGLSGMIMVGVHFNHTASTMLVRIFAVCRMLGRYGELVLSHDVVFRLLKELRVRFFAHFAKKDTRHYGQIGSALAQHRLVKDIDVLNEFPLKVVNPQITTLIVVVLFGLVLARIFSDVVLMGFLAVVVLSWFLMIATRHTARQENAHKEKRAVMLLNTLPSLTQLVLWGRWQDKCDEFLALDGALMAVYQKVHRQRRLGVLLAQWLVVLLVLAVLFVGVGLVDEVGVGVFLAVLFVVFGFFEIATNLSQDPHAFGRSQSAKAHLNALVGDVPTAKTPLPSGALTWHINNVSAKQRGAVFGVVAVNHSVKTGVPLVIQGVSGGGKSTLLDALAGEIDVLGGQSLLEVAGKTLPSQSVDWQGRLGYLGQRIDIFNKTLKENLLLGKPDATDDELWAVLDVVGLKDWAKAEALRLDTPLGEYGVGVSGGQGRRIALARLLLVPRQVLLLDEPFAGLDKSTRTALWQNLKHRQKDGLLIVVSHHDDVLGDGVERLVIGEPAFLA